MSMLPPCALYTAMTRALMLRIAFLSKTREVFMAVRRSRAMHCSTVSRPFFGPPVRPAPAFVSRGRVNINQACGSPTVGHDAWINVDHQTRIILKPFFDSGVCVIKCHFQIVYLRSSLPPQVQSWDVLLHQHITHTRMTLYCTRLWASRNYASTLD